jgi:hypothetical protein
MRLSRIGRWTLAQALNSEDSILGNNLGEEKLKLIDSGKTDDERRRLGIGGMETFSLLSVLHEKFDCKSQLPKTSTTR